MNIDLKATVDAILARVVTAALGLANLYYWIDRQNGVGGFWATQILPFVDPVSFSGYIDFETAFYQSLQQSRAS